MTTKESVTGPCDDLHEWLNADDPIERCANFGFARVAVNACFAVNPQNPKAVAEAIPEAFEIVALIHEAHRPYREELVLQLDARVSALLARLHASKEGE